MYQNLVSYLAAFFSPHKVSYKIVVKDEIYFNELCSETTLVLKITECMAEELSSSPFNQDSL